MKAALVLVCILVAILDNSPVSARSPQNRNGKIDVSVQRQKGVGTRVDVRGQGNVWTSKNGNTKIDAQGQWNRVYRGPGKGRAQYSGGISLEHTNPRGNVGVNVNRERGIGTNVGVQAQGNLWSSRDGRTRIDAQGQWNRNLRGPAAGRAQYEGFVNLSHRFRRDAQIIHNNIA